MPKAPLRDGDIPVPTWYSLFTNDWENCQFLVGYKAEVSTLGPSQDAGCSGYFSQQIQWCLKWQWQLWIFMEPLEDFYKQITVQVLGYGANL